MNKEKKIVYIKENVKWIELSLKKIGNFSYSEIMRVLSKLLEVTPMEIKEIMEGRSKLNKTKINELYECVSAVCKVKKTIDSLCYTFRLPQKVVSEMLEGPNRETIGKIYRCEWQNLTQEVFITLKRKIDNLPKSLEKIATVFYEKHQISKKKRRLAKREENKKYIDSASTLLALTTNIVTQEELACIISGYLFSLEVSQKDSLNQKFFSDTILSCFKSRNIRLSSKAKITVVRQHFEWKIIDLQENWNIRREKKFLEVYRGSSYSGAPLSQEKISKIINKKNKILKREKYQQLFENIVSNKIELYKKAVSLSFEAIKHYWNLLDFIKKDPLYEEISAKFNLSRAVIIELFSPKQRSSYLELQAKYEVKAYQICFFTKKITNALSTDEFLEQSIFGSLSSYLKVYNASHETFENYKIGKRSPN